jgi:hypothetical protein
MELKKGLGIPSNEVRPGRDSNILRLFHIHKTNPKNITKGIDIHTNHFKKVLNFPS